MPEKTWICPLCYLRVPYGTRGCDNPETCPEKKNINYYIKKQMDKSKGIGISEISNEESNEAEGL